MIAFANQKGGVAKTTTTLNLAVAFAEEGHRVLCVDMDPQGNLTMSQGIDPDTLEKSMYDVLVHHISIREVVRKREVDVACSSIDLAGAEIAMSTMIGRERSLQKALKEVEEDYDFVFIDTPPSLGLLTINALTAANKVIVPVQCEYLSMRGLIQLQNTLAMIRENLNPDVDIEGILPDAGRHADAARQGGDRAAGGELRGPGVRLEDPQDRAIRRGSCERDVRAEVRSRRFGRTRLPAAREGGPLKCQPVSARACARDRSPRCSVRRRRTPDAREPGGAAPASDAGRAETPAGASRRPSVGAAAHRAAGAPAPRVLRRTSPRTCSTERLRQSFRQTPET